MAQAQGGQKLQSAQGQVGQKPQSGQATPQGGQKPQSAQPQAGQKPQSAQPRHQSTAGQKPQAQTGQKPQDMPQQPAGQRPQGGQGPQGPQGAKPTAKSLVKPMGYVPPPNEVDLLPEIDFENNRFVIQLYDGDCELLFNIDSTQPFPIITLLTISVPETAQGQGIGNKLAKSAFEYAIENKMDVVIKCPFIAKHFKDHRKKYLDKGRLRVTGRYPQIVEEIDKNY